MILGFTRFISERISSLSFSHIGSTDLIAYKYDDHLPSGGSVGFYPSPLLVQLDCAFLPVTMYLSDPFSVNKTIKHITIFSWFYSVFWDRFAYSIQSYFIYYGLSLTSIRTPTIFLFLFCFLFQGIKNEIVEGKVPTNFFHFLFHYFFAKLHYSWPVSFFNKRQTRTECVFSFFWNFFMF